MSGKWQPFKKFQVAELLPPALRKKLRETFVFVEATGTKQPNQSPEADQGFRTPAPTNQPPATVPTTTKDRVYNIQYYTRDIVRQEVEIITERSPFLPALDKPKLIRENIGSPGNKNPAVLAYDPTGTRSAMTTTHEAMNELIKKEQSTHMVRYEWEPHADEIVADYQRKGLPPVPGRPFPWDMPQRARERRW